MTTTLDPAEIRRRLRAPDLSAVLERLGFAGADHPDALRLAEVAATDDDTVRRLAALAVSLLAAVGRIEDGVEWGRADLDPWAREEATGGQVDPGQLALLTLLVTAPEVAAFHASRGVPDDISWRSLSDLGQQVEVHRRTYGRFGLHTQDWLRVAWNGSLFWLGRLQFALVRELGEWVLSTHIPATGPLTPASVDEAFAAAQRFFATHFAEFPARRFHCGSWLLDPDLADALPAGSNMARFQRRWARYGEPMPGDADALFFTFARRGEVDLDTLPQDTTLQRVIVERLRTGGHWSVWNGFADLDGARP